MNDIPTPTLNAGVDRRGSSVVGEMAAGLGWERLPLRRRFTLFIGGVVLATVGAYTAALLISEARHFRQQAVDAQWKSARLLAHACGEALVNRDELAVLNFFKEMGGASDFREAACLDGRGLVWLDSDVSRIGSQPDLSRTASECRRVGEGGEWAYFVPVLKKGSLLATARVVYDGRVTSREVHRLLGQTARRTLGVPAVALALALVLAWLVARTLTRPILGMAAGARRLAQGDWSARVRTDAPGELGDLAREFNSLSEQLGELDRLKDQFLHTVSHDLRNPLAAVVTSVRLLRADRLPQESLPIVDTIEASMVRLQTMASNLLDIARLREKGLSYRIEPLDVPPLVDELTRLYRALAEEAKKRIVVNLSPHLPRIMADEEKVMRIFFNLMSNAFKFTRAGDSVAVTARPVNGAVEFEVSDTGWGIPPDQLANLFTPYRSTDGATDQARKGQGSGLGLSIVKALVEGQGGRIAVASTPGKGTTFTFHLPTEKGVA